MGALLTSEPFHLRKINMLSTFSEAVLDLYVSITWSNVNHLGWNLGSRTFSTSSQGTLEFGKHCPRVTGIPGPNYKWPKGLR